MSLWKLLGEFQIEYEDLLIICYQCGWFGHVVETCNFHQTDGGHRRVYSKLAKTPTKVDEAPLMGQHHGPWMHVMKRG